MKIKQYIISLFILILLISCSKEEFTIISPINISFVHADGSQILVGECITPNKEYAVLIETTTIGAGNFKTLRVDYTFNGILHTMTFLKDGNQTNPITFVEGINTVQIIESDKSSSITYVPQDDFELVE